MYHIGCCLGGSVPVPGFFSIRYDEERSLSPRDRGIGLRHMSDGIGSTATRAASWPRWPRLLVRFSTAAARTLCAVHCVRGPRCRPRQSIRTECGPGWNPAAGSVVSRRYPARGEFLLSSWCSSRARSSSRSQCTCLLFCGGGRSLSRDSPTGTGATASLRRAGR
jgi:hypothetical protein